MLKFTRKYTNSIFTVYKSWKIFVQLSDSKANEYELNLLDLPLDANACRSQLVREFIIRRLGVDNPETNVQAFDWLKDYNEFQRKLVLKWIFTLYDIPVYVDAKTFYRDVETEFQKLNVDYSKKTSRGGTIFSNIKAKDGLEEKSMLGFISEFEAKRKRLN